MAASHQTHKRERTWKERCCGDDQNVLVEDDRHAKIPPAAPAPSWKAPTRHPMSPFPTPRQHLGFLPMPHETHSGADKPPPVPKAPPPAGPRPGGGRRTAAPGAPDPAAVPEAQPRPHVLPAPREPPPRAGEPRAGDPLPALLPTAAGGGKGRTPVISALNPANRN